MQITQDSGEGNQITAYEVGRVTVNDTVLTHSLIITPVMLIHDWGVNSLHSLSTEHCERLLQVPGDVYIVGTGETLQRPAATVLQYANKRGITLELMDNRAACRTYSVLAAEQRHVALGLIINNYPSSEIQSR